MSKHGKGLRRYDDSPRALQETVRLPSLNGMLVVRRLFYAAVVLSLAGCGGSSISGPAPRITPSAAPTATPTPSPIPTIIAAGNLLPSPGSIYLGAYVDSSGLPGGSGPTETAAFEASIGRKLALDNQYKTWVAKFSGIAQKDDFAQGRIPIYSWDCGISNDAITKKQGDSTLAYQANWITLYKWPVFVRFFYDPNLPAADLSRNQCLGAGDQGGDFNPATYIAAWRYVRNYLVSAGATNAVFVWSVNSKGSDPTQYYPGDAYVDWVGMDVYNPDGSGFQATYSGFYTTLSKYKKPIMISETGTLQPAQPSFFSGAAATLQSDFPMVMAYVYYDAIGPTIDWRLTPQGLSAFTPFANDPYMGAMYHAQ